MSFNINNKLVFIDSFQFLSSSLNNLVKNLGKDYFKNLSQEFDSDVLDLVKQKGFYPYEYMQFKEKFPSKEKFYGSLMGKKFSDEKYENFLKIWYRFQIKTIKYYYNLYLKCDFLLLVGVFEKLINNSL